MFELYGACEYLIHTAFRRCPGRFLYYYLFEWRISKMLNTISLMGRFTAQPELMTTRTGVSNVSFTLAVQRDYEGHDGGHEADFIDCVAWRNTAEFVNRNFGKGDLVALTGTLQTHVYTDREGKSRKAINVLVSNVYFTGYRSHSTEFPEETSEAEPEIPQ